MMWGCPKSRVGGPQISDDAVPEIPVICRNGATQEQGFINDLALLLPVLEPASRTAAMGESTTASSLATAESTPGACDFRCNPF